ncbi:MAG TPA: class I SAM-dependent methyltransferase [Rhizomicrobium sp.]|nr:class I SAM-dependent methyltransferase [Rhizomicrobium sp.]
MDDTNKRLPQAMRPRGRIGRIFGWLMARMNKSAYRWTVEQLRAAHPKSLLEIGFGTGHLLSLATRKLKLTRVTGVDPSDLMVGTAQKRLRRFRKKAAIELKRGDDTALPMEGAFDAIAALHSFQFWTHPATTLAHIRALLAPNGRFVLVLRVAGKRKNAPNPLSRGADEVSQAIAAAQSAGFVVLAMRGISKSSQGIVFGCG